MEFKAQFHHSVIINLNDSNAANKFIANGYYIDHLHYANVEVFSPQFKLPSASTVVITDITQHNANDTLKAENVARNTTQRNVRAQS